MPFSAPVLTYRAKALASNMCSKVLNGHIILTDTSITTILAPEMTYTPLFHYNFHYRSLAINDTAYYIDAACKVAKIFFVAGAAVDESSFCGVN